MKSDKRKRRDLIVWLIENAIYLYVMFVGFWAVCRLLTEIFTKLGVA